MSHALPSAIRDPKTASTVALELALGTPSVVDRAKPDEYALAAEEYTRRTGDVQFLGSEYVSEVYFA
jgi:uncharacterized membrane protein